MSCMTLIAQPIAMATTQLVSAIHHEDATLQRVGPRAEHKPLRMSWVVVTDEHGKQQLRMHWVKQDC
jgi:hypothetical protein